MNELADYLTNSVSSRRGTLVVGQRIVSAHQPFSTENTNHAGQLHYHVQCACIYIRATGVHLSPEWCVTLFVKRLIDMDATANLTSYARLQSGLDL